ncbi:Hypothetical predicted protein [Olea europaea subsp. europaea]|uniref:Uncharacterized protein n=1 Tax=Olea europaea subsp. europaea TaxID=158383 RepID=A0A8S0PKX2_OLEEU|nr:Hypothetical predicted protein [Olea europaea subsp. europaea]
MKAETWASCVRDTVTGMKHHVQTKSGTQAQEENIVCRLCLGWVQAMERRRAHFQAHRSSKDFEVIQGHEGSTVCRRYPGCRHTKAATCRGRVWDTSTRRQHRVQALSGTQGRMNAFKNFEALSGIRRQHSYGVLALARTQTHEGSNVGRPCKGRRHTKTAPCASSVSNAGTRRQHRVQVVLGMQVHEDSIVCRPCQGCRHIFRDTKVATFIRPCPGRVQLVVGTQTHCQAHEENTMCQPRQVRGRIFCHCQALLRTRWHHGVQVVSWTQVHFQAISSMQRQHGLNAMLGTRAHDVSNESGPFQGYKHMKAAQTQAHEGSTVYRRVRDVGIRRQNHVQMNTYAGCVRNAGERQGREHIFMDMKVAPFLKPCSGRVQALAETQTHFQAYKGSMVCMPYQGSKLIFWHSQALSGTRWQHGL